MIQLSLEMPSQSIPWVTLNPIKLTTTPPSLHLTHSLSCFPPKWPLEASQMCLFSVSWGWVAFPDMVIFLFCASIWSSLYTFLNNRSHFALQAQATCCFFGEDLPHTLPVSAFPDPQALGKHPSLSSGRTLALAVWKVLPPIQPADWYLRI